MDKGSPEWIAEHAHRVSVEAAPQLLEIAESSYKLHGLSCVELNQNDMIRIAMLLRDVQEQSFILGVRLGMKLLFEGMQE